MRPARAGTESAGARRLAGFGQCSAQTLAQTLDPAAVGAEVRIPDPGSRTHVDLAGGLVETEFDVVDEPADGGAEFVAKVIGLFLDEAGSGAMGENLAKQGAGVVEGAGEGQGLDMVFGIVVFADHAVG